MPILIDVFYEDRTKAGYQIKRLPVKILGSSSVQTVQQSSQQSSQQSQNDRFNTDIHTFDEIIQTNVQRIFSFPRGSKHLPEVAIAGRSNVGKSTLLNVSQVPSFPKFNASISNLPFILSFSFPHLNHNSSFQNLIRRYSMETK